MPRAIANKNPKLLRLLLSQSHPKIEIVLKMPTIITNRRHITLDLIRKRAEHNEGLVSNLEEIALHQEELEAIGPILGRTCGKTLRILLLQNNVIDRMDPADLKHFKRLEYLNLAINNIHNVQGIAHLEFLEKIDLTLNFIHLNSLRESLEAMVPLRSLKELHLMGNPCSLVDTKNKQGWHGYRNYVIAKLPQLQHLDGTIITRSERIRALRNLISLEQELDTFLNQEIRPPIQEFECGDVEDPIQDDEPTQHCPQVRLRISHEMAAQKAEKEKLEKANHPPVKGEQEAIEEQHLVMERARVRLEQGEVRQCNEGKWNFQFDEDLKPGFLSLHVSIPKHLSSALIDVDVHPNYITLVIKSKILRLVLPVEVNAEKSTAQRSTASGKLVISMPKCLTKQGSGSSYTHEVSSVSKLDIQERNGNKTVNKCSRGRSTLGADMIAESLKAKGIGMEEYINEVSSRRLDKTSDFPIVNMSDEVEEVPPLF